VAELKFLVSRLEPTALAALEDAALSAVQMGHAEVENVHLVLALLDRKRDVSSVMDPSIDLSRIKAESQAALSNLPKKSVKIPLFSKHLARTLNTGWNLALQSEGSGRISCQLLLSAIDEAGGLPEPLATEFRKLPKGHGAAAQGSGSTTGGPTEAGMLAEFTVDLTAAARAGVLDPVVGREPEIRQVMNILSRRRQNNPVLIGEAGVGKTAIAEGVAIQIAAGNAPPAFRNARLLSLDPGLLMAGASVQGQLEQRIKGVLQEVRASAGSVILFIDEAHVLVGKDDAANLLKPALARGELRAIAATTVAEYRKHFERDAAMVRRFQPVLVDEPSEESATDMLRKLVPKMERHHGIRVAADAVESAVRLSQRYIAGRQLPDKAIAVLDTACARVALARSCVPALLADCQGRVAVLEERGAELQRNRLLSPATEDRSGALFDELAAAEMQSADLEDRWTEERRLVDCVEQIQSALENVTEDQSAEAQSLQSQLVALRASLKAVQGENPLVPAAVDGRVVAEVISDSTGIPIGRMLRSDVNTVANLCHALDKRVAGQRQALEIIARRIVSARAGLEDPQRPTGVFLLAGPSGVGKTETALALADLLYGGESHLVTINMSEYHEAHSVSGLRGSPPGYVGYGEGGILTEAVRRQPYCVLLLDEIDQAHRDVHELFYQIFDKGKVEDAQGLPVSFRNTLILMTSNLGAASIQRSCEANPTIGAEVLAQTIYPELTAVFHAALLSRTIIVPYRPIDAPTLQRIVELKVEQVAARLRESHGLDLVCSDRVMLEIHRRSADSESGARDVERTLTETIVPDISERLLTGAGHGSRRVVVDVASGGAFRYRFE
jgi:type VI secretion system protein VasG